MLTYWTIAKFNKMNICFHGPWYSSNCKGFQRTRVITEEKFRSEYYDLKEKLMREMRVEGHILLAKVLKEEFRRDYDLLRDTIKETEGGWNSDNLWFESKENNGYHGIRRNWDFGDSL